METKLVGVKNRETKECRNSEVP